MKNKVMEKNMVLQILVENGKAVISDSALDFVTAAYGVIVTSIEKQAMKDFKIEVCVNKDSSIKIMNVEKNSEMMSWDDEFVDEKGSSFLLYVLSEKVELLLYKSPNPRYKFSLTSVPQRNASTGEFLSKVESLPHFKAFLEIYKLILDTAHLHYKNVHGFVFNKSM